MNAKEARKLTEENQITDISKYLELIKRAAQGGYSMLKVEHKISWREKNALEELGYTIKHETGDQRNWYEFWTIN